VFAFAHDSIQREPCTKREYIFTRVYLGLRNPFGKKPLKDGFVIRDNVAADRTPERCSGLLLFVHLHLLQLLLNETALDSEEPFLADFLAAKLQLLLC
jgi:hypothetical protein